MYNLDQFHYLSAPPDVKDKLITIALAEVFGSRKWAASLLGISVHTLEKKIKKRIAKNE